MYIEFGWQSSAILELIFLHVIVFLNVYTMY